MIHVCGGLSDVFSNMIFYALNENPIFQVTNEVVVPGQPSAMAELLEQGRVDLVPVSRVEGRVDPRFAYTVLNGTV